MAAVSAVSVNCLWC